MDWNEAKDQLLAFLTLGCIGWITYELRNLRVLAEKSSITLAVLADKFMYRERQIDDHDHRIKKIEHKFIREN